MNYHRIYTRLIEKARSENRTKGAGIYYEQHHILPKCLGGLDEDLNLVLLTAKEHYLAHLLLIELYPGNKSIVFAWHSMSRSTNYMERNVFSSREYSFARKLHSEYLSENSDVFAKSNTGRIWMKKGDKCIRVSIEDFPKYIDLGYIKGRIIKHRTSHSEETKSKISKSQTGKVSPQKGKPSKNKGKTYEELYGEERAAKLKEIRRVHIIKLNKQKSTDENCF